jgi:hypothetical protein
MPQPPAGQAAKRPPAPEEEMPTVAAKPAESTATSPESRERAVPSALDGGLRLSDLASYRQDVVMDLIGWVIARGRPDRAPKSSSTAPVVVVFGPGGSGRTSVLDTVRQELAGKVQPCALIDPVRLGWRGSQVPVADLLTHVVFELLRDGRWRWTFPRFLMIRLVMAMRADSSDVAGTRERILAVRSADEVHQWLTRIATDARVPDPDPVAWQLATRLAGHRWPRPGRPRSGWQAGYEWHGLAGRPDSEAAVAGLVALGGSYAQATHVEQAEFDTRIVHAFLTDLDDTGTSRFGVTDPVLLIDDAGNSPAARLLAARRSTPGGRLTVVLAGDRAFLDALQVPPDVVRWRRDELEAIRDGKPSAGRSRPDHSEWVPLPLLGLTERTLLDMAEQIQIPAQSRRSVTQVVFAVTAGHAGASGVLMRAASHIAQTEVTAEDLLSWTPAGRSAEPVADLLLKWLLRSGASGSELLDGLVTSAAARNAVDAAYLARQLTIDHVELFSPAHWSQEQHAGAAEMHPLLRLLLLRRLAARPAEAENGWRPVFLSLATIAEHNHDVVGKLYYRFAAGEIDQVVTEMKQRLRESSGSEWLRFAELAASCPLPTGHVPDAIDSGADAVKQVLAAMRGTTDPYLVGHWADGHAAVATFLPEVAKRATGDLLEFVRVTKHHRELANDLRNE